jgi:hypothetical protein
MVIPQKSLEIEARKTHPGNPIISNQIHELNTKFSLNDISY